MYIGLQEIYLLVDPKGYPFVPISEPSEYLVRAERGYFNTIHEKNQYILQLAQKAFLSKRMTFYAQEKIVELNYILDLIDKGLRTSIKKLKDSTIIQSASQEYNVNENLEDIEDDIIEYFKILIKLPDIAFDLRINYNLFVKGFDNFSQIFLYSDNNELLLYTYLFYLIYYKHQGATLYEMPPEDQELLGSLFCAYLSYQNVSNRMQIGDLFESIIDIKKNKIDKDQNVNESQKGCQLQNINIHLDFEICNLTNIQGNSINEDEQQNSKSSSSQPTSNITLQIYEEDIDQFDLANTKCFIAADKILKKYMNDNEYQNQKRKNYSLGFIKLLFELKIAKSYKITEDTYLLGVQQLVFLHLNLIGAKKSLHNYSQFINQKPIQPLDAYYDQLLLQKHCLTRLIDNTSCVKETKKISQNKSQISSTNQINKFQQNQNRVSQNNQINQQIENENTEQQIQQQNNIQVSGQQQAISESGLQQDNQTNNIQNKIDKHIHLILRSLSNCGPLIAHMCMYKIESKFVNQFKITNEQSICELWVQFFEKILQLTFENERQIHFQDYLVLFKVFDSFINEVEYFGIDMRQHLEDITNITIQEKVSQVQDVFKKIFEKLQVASKTFLQVKMQEFIQQPKKYILNSLLLCELISIDPDLAFKVFQQFLGLMLNSSSYIIEELGEQSIEKIFLNLISYIFKEKITNSTQYIQSLINRQLFIDIKAQIIQKNPFGHLILNQILYHILEAEIQFTTRYLLYQVDSQPEKVWEILAEIFKLLSDRNQIVFLKGFRLIKRFLEELIDIYKRNEQIIHNTKVCQVYSELCVKNTLIWGQRSGIQEHTEVIQFTYPEIQKQLKIQMIQLMDMIKQEDDFLIRYLDKNNIALKKKLKNIKNKKKNSINSPTLNKDELGEKDDEDDLENYKFSYAYHCMFNLLEFKYKVLCSNSLYYINCICATLNRSLSQSEFEEIFLYCLNCCSPLIPQIQKKAEKESNSNQAQLRHQATELFGRLRRFSDSDSQPVLMVMTEVCKDYLENLPLLLKRLSIQMRNSSLYSKCNSKNNNLKHPFMMMKFWKDQRQSFLKLLQNFYFTGEHYEILKQIRQCELVIFLFKKAILNLYSVGHYINSNEFYDNYALICQKAIESQEILSVSFLDEMCAYQQYKIDKAHQFATEYSNYQLTLQQKFHKYEKGTFISDTKWTNTFDKFIFRNLRLPKMIFKITLIATKLKRVDLSLIPSAQQSERRFSQRYSRMIREISYQIVKYNCRNIVLLSQKMSQSPLTNLIKYFFYVESLRSNTEGIPNSHNCLFIPIMCSELYSSCSMIISSVLQTLKAQNITIDFQNNQLLSIEKNMLRDVFFSFLKHHDNFYSFIMRDMIIQPRIFAKRYLISTEILPHYKEEIENCDGYFKIATEFTSYMKHIFSSMPIYAKYNEQIPEKLAESFFEMTKEYHKDKTLTDKEKQQVVCYLEDLALRILNLYLHSTYVNQVRTRSSHINKVIYSYINFKIKNQDEILQQKKIISIFFLKQMELHLQDFIPQWNVETNGGYVLRDCLLQKFKPIYQQSDIENKLLLYKPNSLDPILNACTLAMIMNLLCRLIQESPEMDPSLDQGMKYVFGQSWVSCKYFLKYISKVLDQTKFRKIGTDESNTLDFDPIRYSMVITENLLNHSADILLKIEKSQNMQRTINIDLKDPKYSEIFRKENWQELFDFSVEIIKNYLNMETIQIHKFQNHTILGIRSAPLRKFIGTMTMSIYQEPNEYKIKRVLQEVLPLLQKTPIKQNNFSGWTNSLFKLLRQLCDAVFIFNSSYQFKKECLKLHMFDIFYDRFECQIVEQFDYLKLKNFSGSIFAAQPEIFLDILNAYFDIENEEEYKKDYFSQQASKVSQNSQLYKIKDKSAFLQNDLSVNKIPSFCQELLTFLIESFASSLQAMLEQVYQQKERVFHSTFSHEVCLKILIQLCGKYPLIIPYVISHELNVDNLLLSSIQVPHLYNTLNSFVQQKNNKITFVEYLFITSPFSFNISRQFFKFISNSLSYAYFEQGKDLFCFIIQKKKVLFLNPFQILKNFQINQKDCPYGTKDENGNIRKLIIGSNQEFKNYLVLLHEQQIESFLQQQDILQSDQDAIILRDLLVSYYQLHLSGGYSCQLNISIDEEQYLKNHSIINLPFYYLQRKENSLRKCYQTFSKIMLKCSTSIKNLNILTAIDFYSMFNQVYKEIVQIQYSYFTNKFYAKGVHNLKLLKQLSNKQLVAFMTEKNVEYVILNVCDINKQKWLQQSKENENSKDICSSTHQKQEAEDSKIRVSLPSNLLLKPYSEMIELQEQQGSDQQNNIRKYSESPDNYNKNKHTTELDAYLRKNSKESFAKFYVSRGAWSTCVFNSTSKINTLEYLKTQVQQNVLVGSLSNQFYSEYLEWQLNYMSEDEDTDLFFSQYIYDCENIDKWPKKNNNLKPQNIYQTLLLEFSEKKLQEQKQVEFELNINNQQQDLSLVQKQIPDSTTNSCTHTTFNNNKSYDYKFNLDSQSLQKTQGNQKSILKDNVTKNQDINISLSNLQTNILQNRTTTIREADSQQQGMAQLNTNTSNNQINNLRTDTEVTDNLNFNYIQNNTTSNNIGLQDQQLSQYYAINSIRGNETNIQQEEEQLDQRPLYPNTIFNNQNEILEEPNNFTSFEERKDDIPNKQPRREDNDNHIDQNNINNNENYSGEDRELCQQRKINISYKQTIRLQNNIHEGEARNEDSEENNSGNENIENENYQHVRINDINSCNKYFNVSDDRYIFNSSNVLEENELQANDEREEQKQDYPNQIQNIQNTQNGQYINSDTLFYESMNKNGRSEEIHIEDGFDDGYIDEIQEDQQNDNIVDEDHAFDQESQEILLEFDWTLLDFPKNALNLYGVDKQLFRLATDEEKVEILVQAQEKYQFTKEREQADLINRAQTRNAFNFEAHGFDSTCLDDFDIDHNYFYSLPDDVKLEILNMMRAEINLSQNGISPNNNANRSHLQMSSSGNNSLSSAVEEAKTPKKQNLSPEQKAHLKLKMIFQREQMSVKSLISSSDFQSRFNYRKQDIKEIVSFLKKLDPQTQEGILKLADNNLVEKLPKEMRQRAINLRRQYNQHPPKDPFNSYNGNTLNDLSNKRNITRRMYDLVYLPSIDDLVYQDSDFDSDENNESNLSIEGDVILEGGSELDEKDSQIISLGCSQNANQSSFNNSDSDNDINNGERKYEDNKESYKSQKSTIKKDKKINYFDMTNSEKTSQNEAIQKKKTDDIKIFNYGINSAEYFMSLDQIDDEILIGIIHNAIFAPIRMQSSDNFAGFTDNIFKVLKLLSLSPVNGYKIADALTFYLSLSEQRYLEVIKHLSFYQEQEDRQNILLQKSEIQSRICSIIRRLLGANVCVPLYIQGVINTNKPLKLSSPTGNQMQVQKLQSQNIISRTPQFQRGNNSANFTQAASQGQGSSYTKYLVPIQFITKMRNELSKGSISTVYSSYLENSSVFELGIKLIGEQILSKTHNDDGLLIVDYILGKSEFASSNMPIDVSQNDWSSSQKNTQGLNSDEQGKEEQLGKLRNRKLSHDVNLTTNQLAESTFQSLLSQNNRGFRLNNPNTENEFFNYDQLVQQQQQIIKKKNQKKQLKKNQQLNNKKNKIENFNRRGSNEVQLTTIRSIDDNGSQEGSPTNAVNNSQTTSQINTGIHSLLHCFGENNISINQNQLEPESNYSNYITHNDKYILGEQIINSNFMKTFCEIIFKSNKRIKANNNLLGIVKSLIKFRSANFVTILCGILEQYGRQLAEMMQKIQQNTDNFKSQVLQKNNYNMKTSLVEQITDSEQLGVILSKFEMDTVDKLTSQFDFREVFHSLRHFIKDMKRIFEQYILEEAIKLYTQNERKQREREIKKINKQIQTIINTNTPTVSMLDIGSCLNFTSRHNLELARLQEKIQTHKSMSSHNLQKQKSNQNGPQSSHTLSLEQQNSINLQPMKSNDFLKSSSGANLQSSQNCLNGLPSLSQNNNLSMTEIAALSKHKKDELIQSMKKQISQKQKELKNYMEDQTKSIRIQFTNFLKKKVYAIRSLNLAFRECVEYIFAVQEIIGQDFESNNSQTLEIYCNWKYALKSIIILHQFVNPYNQEEELKKQFNENTTPQNKMESNNINNPEENLKMKKRMSYDSSDEINCSSLNSSHDYYMNNNSIDLVEEIEDDGEGPRLSRLFTHEETDPTKLPTSLLFRSKSASNQPKFDIDSTFNLMYLPKIMSTLEQFIYLNSDRLDNFHHFIRNAEKKDKLPLKLKLNFLRSLARQNAIDKQPNLQDEQTQSIKFVIDREKTWFSTLDYLSRYTPAEMTTKQIKIQFKDEDGIDYGGLTREWLALLSKEVFNPDYCLFQLSANKRSIQPSPLSMIIPDHLNHFLFLGRLVGKSLVENWHFDINFCRSFLKHMLKKNLYVNDLEDIDPELSRNLVWMLENDVDDLMYDFSYVENILGQQKIIELITDGQNVAVTEENKKKYVKEFCIAKMILNIEKQAKAFIRGLEQIIPREALELFNEQELGLHLTGMPTVDIEDMKKNTQYQYYTENNRVIKWFWEVLQEENEISRANFLFFLTGSFKVPYGGFKNFPLKIDRGVSPESLPVAHTCFNQIDLPEYESKEKLKEKLLIAISEGSSGFHIG